MTCLVPWLICLHIPKNFPNSHKDARSHTEVNNKWLQKGPKSPRKFVIRPWTCNVQTSLQSLKFLPACGRAGVLYFQEFLSTVRQGPYLAGGRRKGWSCGRIPTPLQAPGSLAHERGMGLCRNTSSCGQTGARRVQVSRAEQPGRVHLRTLLLQVLGTAGWTE